MRLLIVVPLVVVVLAVLVLNHLLMRRPLPRVLGSAEVTGPDAAVEIVRDRWGVAHVVAATTADAAFAAGVAHAQDRGWQLEVLRRLGRAELASLVGADARGADLLVDRLGIPAAARADAAALEGEPLRLLEAYAAGVRTITEHGPRPLELTLLRARAGAWTVADSLAVLRLALLDLTGVAASLPPSVVARLPLASGRGGGTAAAVRGRDGSAPLLVCDLAAPATLPAAWVSVHLVATDGLEVTGAAVPGFPLPLAGHGAAVAWGAGAGTRPADEVLDALRGGLRELVPALLAMARARDTAAWREAAAPLVTAGLALVAADRTEIAAAGAPDPVDGIAVVTGRRPGDAARAERLRQLLAATGRADAAFLRRAQMDTVDATAFRLARALAGVRCPDGFAEEARRALTEWDGSFTAEATEPTVAAALQAELEAATGMPVTEILDRVDGGEATVSGRPWSEVAPAAVVAAVTRLRARRGRPSRWRWGLGQRLAAAHLLGSRWPFRLLLHGRRLEVGGAAGTVHRVAVDAGIAEVPCWRAVLAPAAWDDSTSVLLPGESGHPGSRHWDDGLELWLRNRQHPLPWSRAAVTAAARGRLVLRPAARGAAAAGGAVEAAS